jgi:opacity protein-like surface antigen
MQISGIEDDASDEELGSFSSDRLGSYYIGVWKSTDWKIGSLPVTIGAELGHRGTSSNYETDSSEDQPLMYINSAEILITYLDLWTSVNYRMSDKFNLWIGPSIGIHLDEKVTLDIGGQEAESAELSTDFGFDENDFGFLVGAGYSISKNIYINAGLYKGLKDHDGGKFNNLFIDLGYSF